MRTTTASNGDHAQGHAGGEQEHRGHRPAHQGAHEEGQQAQEVHLAPRTAVDQGGEALPGGAPGDQAGEEDEEDPGAGARRWRPRG